MISLSKFIKQGKAYVDEQTAEQIAEQKGTPTEPGVASPYRDRPIDENLRLFKPCKMAKLKMVNGTPCEDRHG